MSHLRVEVPTPATDASSETESPAPPTPPVRRFGPRSLAPAADLEQRLASLEGLLQQVLAGNGAARAESAPPPAPTGRSVGTQPSVALRADSAAAPRSTTRFRGTGDAFRDDSEGDYDGHDDNDSQVSAYSVSGPDGSSASFDQVVAYLADFSDQTFGGAFAVDIRRIRRIAGYIDTAFRSIGQDDDSARQALASVALELSLEVGILQTRYEDGDDVAHTAALLFETRVATHPLRSSIAAIQSQARRATKARRPTGGATVSFQQPAFVPFGSGARGQPQRQPTRQQQQRDPPYPCRHCGGPHWERACPASGGQQHPPRGRFPPPPPQQQPFPYGQQGNFVPFHPQAAAPPQ